MLLKAAPNPCAFTNCPCFKAVFRRIPSQCRRLSVLTAATGDKDLLTEITEEVRGEGAGKQAPKKGFGSVPSTSAKPKQKQQQRPFQVQSPVSQKQPPTPGQQLEAGVVQLLTFIFVIFFVEGLFLAVSGFLPEAADNFAMSVVYPAFSPTLGVFLTISVIYGLVKSRQG